MKFTQSHKQKLDDALAEQGLRATRQREHIFQVIIESNHPTAEEVYREAKHTMPTISLATVYNCLETFVECGLVRQFNFDREATRYDPDLTDHAHFQCKDSGSVFDIPMSREVIDSLTSILPVNFEAEAVELSFKGKAPEKITI